MRDNSSPSAQGQELGGGPEAQAHHGQLSGQAGQGVGRQAEHSHIKHIKHVKNGYRSTET